MPYNYSTDLMRKIFFIINFLFLNCILSQAQTGGNNTYEFLNLSTSARVAAMGGNILSVRDNDLNLAIQNPAVMDSTMSKALVLNYVPYFADIKYGYVAYAQDYKNIGTFSAGIHYVDYGTFMSADNTGYRDETTFGASEYSFNLAYAREVYTRVRTGITLKTIYSSLEQFTSFGLAADLGIIYNNVNNNFGIAVTIKNIGAQLTTYIPGNNEPIPFEIQLGTSYRLPKAPLRLSLTLQHLEKPDLTYINTNTNNQTDPITGEVTEQKISLFEKIARHAIIGGEILITQNFNLRVGYNYMRRKDLSIDTHTGTSGFSGGFGFRISKFHFSYGRAVYHLAGGSNLFSITTNIGAFRKKVVTDSREEN
ncbi:MAG: type IX secretion system protein PorQ [Bacteroidia bacterium]